MKKLFLLTLLLAIIFVGCATTSMVKQTPEGNVYLEKAKLQPLTFSIPVENEKEAWGRAQSFIARYSAMKLQVVTDFVIQTYNPGEYEIGHGYYVTKTPMEDSIEINVRCITGMIFDTKDTTNNAHILAHYIVTGENPPDGIVVR